MSVWMSSSDGAGRDAGGQPTADRLEPGDQHLAFGDRDDPGRA